MSKREFDGAIEGPPTKLFKDDDDNGSGRTGRVRKKSAKVLEMEEFEQAEKGHGGKKFKTPKGATGVLSNTQMTPTMIESSSELVIDQTPTTKKAKTVTIASPQAISSPKATDKDVDYVAALAELNSIVKTETKEVEQAKVKSAPAKPEEASVIKHLLNSPVPGSKANLKTSLNTSDESSKKSKKIKSSHKREKSSSKEKSKKKLKMEIASPSLDSSQPLPIKQVSGKSTNEMPGLKMKIISGSSSTAQVAMSSDYSTPKPKKSKKQKHHSDPDTSDVSPSPQPKEKKKSKKSSKKKEKLIQEAITAAQQMPNLAALASPTGGKTQGDHKKTSKKKTKTQAANSSSDGEGLKLNFMDDKEESNLVIAETEHSKKKNSPKKKAAHKDKEKDELEADKKLAKRSPTAYMLFCNANRPDIVNENPGIDFASISRKLGELWQGQSKKQKLSWRKKAQTRLKKSNLISTGKTKEISTPVAVPSQAPMVRTSHVQSLKLGTLLQQRGVSVRPADEGLTSPTKVCSETEPEESMRSSALSIEPIDVAAHLKLLGESLSIIGMRLQEHKGMIAVQGSLSVLLDSLLCALGPLLCLTQQVPGMDGCSIQLHGQTLDSVAYVMPGL